MGGWQATHIRTYIGVDVRMDRCMYVSYSISHTVCMYMYV